MLHDEDDEEETPFLLEDVRLRRRLRNMTYALSFFAVASVALAASLTYVVHDRAPAPISSEYSFLNNYCADIPAITLEEYATRRSSIASQVSLSGHAAFVTEPGATMKYLVDVSWKLSERPFLFAIVPKEDGLHDEFFVVPAFEEGTAREAIGDALGAEPDLVLWEENENPYALLAARINAAAGSSIYIDPDSRSFITFGLLPEFPSVDSGLDILRSVRAIKSDAEIAILRCANIATKSAIRAVAERLSLGMSEDDAAAHMSAALESAGLTDVWQLVLFDKNAAYPHGTANRTALANGMMILIDAGGDLLGYQSDISRTFTFPLGQTDERQRDMWSAVHEAQHAAFSAIKVGNEAQTLDIAARASVSSDGYGSGYEYFTHRLGHGIGLQGHEEVYMVQGNTVPLQKGMCFSVEPGLYDVTYGGVRIEDIVCITRDTCDGTELCYEVFGPRSESLEHPFEGH